MMRATPYIKEYLGYCPEEGQLIWIKRPKQSKVRVGEVAGGVNPKGYRQIKFAGRAYRAHNLVWLWHHGSFPADGLFVDHKDCDPDNNNIGNLRLCTQSQNNCNRRGYGSTPAKNVFLCGYSGKYRVRIRDLEGRSINLGSWEDLELAELIAHEAREKYHGEFARHG